MKTSQSYKRHTPEGKFDAIIIGSGMGGLTSGAILAKEGKRVLILEAHYTPGGFTHVFKRPGYEWDVGIHYIGEVERPDSFTRVLFDYITNGNLHWADMGEVYDRIIFGKKEYPFEKGKENFRRNLKTWFRAPEDHQAIDQYLQLLAEVGRVSRGFFTTKALPQPLSWFSALLSDPKFQRYSGKTTLEVLSSLTSNPELIGVLAGQYGDYGLPPGQSSFAIHAMVARHFLAGGCYPVGGSASIVETVAPVIQAAGGEIVTNAEVSEIILEGKTAVGVRMADGKELRAPLVISSAGVINTYGTLIPAAARESLGLEKKLHTVQPSVSHLCLYIGAKGSTAELNLGKANYWLYPDNYDHDHNVKAYLEDPENQPFPVVYISFPSAKDPEWENRYPGKSTLEIITLAPYDWYEKWENEPWKKRGEEYEAQKERLAQKLLEKLYEFEPQLRGKIDFYELSTPLSTRKFTLYQKGEIYGIDHTPERYQQKWLKPSTPFKGLWLTGQDIVSAGIGGAMAAGLITASAILKKNIVPKMFQQHREKAPLV
ncbi:MAG: NAD(P)/FAD-dependent oxidoreductase [Bacteroidia bacterium]|nr:NAD(P)/FAD-dependent oxidoreductase [Bacteroidia bacterium]